MMRLHINIDHVATVRQARQTNEPDPVRAAVLAELGGADGITVHLREDRRHIQERDVRLLLETVRTGVNLELAATSDVLQLALGWKPMTATLVPEKREEVTTEGGLALATAEQRARLQAAVSALRAGGIRTSLFVEPELPVLDACAALGADAVELHTGEYAEAWKLVHRAGGHARVTHELQKLRRGAAHARALGLAVHAGHGLTYENVSLVAGLDYIEELNIGHTVISRAVLTGMVEAVRELKSIVLAAAYRRAPAGQT
ncbi:MAG: pyridoxine 5'-phosphate synthase [Gemmatimonadetes bacterium]|nr:pyridoxine 5'-phosphate synthase [Gemmatimonadota bacterium]